MRHRTFIVEFIVVVSSITAQGQESARTVQYHSQDIVPIRAKLKYTTLIELPTTEKIMEAATGDKDFTMLLLNPTTQSARQKTPIATNADCG